MNCQTKRVQGLGQLQSLMAFNSPYTSEYPKERLACILEVLAKLYKLQWGVQVAAEADLMVCEVLPAGLTQAFVRI